ncbi:tRNA threonylcarbamoyladenosine biosynthesis protein RimN [Blattabacterium sp. (Nauphoeta cinerea)]|uniref:L-threonylcarbamoyladenylate synthase n=1 Tax=Blattabacterium sp. (Nauphoeta cinerea) TaxID=1316444 RepID=UPI0003B08A5C|nr:L-threonylcarbamoyladenylate synthase [Blattabacterium sp. (Nauphoeta cinerea)]AGW86219.1 tRNA threonylcarbamoyladenosine biosynthesis protein RimN [Blattabacterium sp. (Nauphoeta cinerea)]
MSFYGEIEKSVEILKKGKVLLHPTDTVWGLGCDAFNIQAIKKICEIKNRNISKSMILLVESMDRLHQLVGKISFFTQKIIFDNLVKKDKPITIVYENEKKMASHFFKKDRTLAVRLTYDPFCICLIRNLDRPIVSTSANLSGFVSPKSFSEISPSILDKTDYVVNFRREEKAIYSGSSIIKIVANQVKILRM